jgi:Rieske Fe-S protein
MLACLSGPGRASANTRKANLPQAGDYLVLADAGGEQGVRIRLELVPDGTKLVQALSADGTSGKVRDESRFAKVILVRLPPEEMDEDTRRLSVDGGVAYSAICTHQGCTLNAWKAAERKIACFCHHSEFRADQGGKVAKGPATRRLPQLSLELGPDGEIVVAGGFTAKPGPKA